MRTFGSVNSSDLTPWQAKKLFGVVEKFAWFLHRLRRRMEAKRFRRNDPLYRAVLHAQ